MHNAPTQRTQTCKTAEAQAYWCIGPGDVEGNVYLYDARREGRRVKRRLEDMRGMKRICHQ